MKKIFSYFLAVCMSLTMFTTVGNVNAKGSDESNTPISGLAEDIIEVEELEEDTNDLIVEVEEVKEDTEKASEDELIAISGDDEEIVQENAGSYGMNKVTFSTKSATIGMEDGPYADILPLVVTIDYAGYSDIPYGYDLYGTDSSLSKIGLNGEITKTNNSSRKIATYVYNFYGVKTGTATFYAKDSKYGKTYGTFKLTIKKAPIDMKVSKKTITLSEGQTATIKTSAPSGYACNDSAFYYVNTSAISMTQDGAIGTITALKEGTAYVYGLAYNGVKSSKPCVVNVLPGPYTISIAGKTDIRYLKLKQSFTIKPTSLDKYGQKVKLVSYTYTSSNPSVATVSSSGKVTAKALGQTTIRVTAHNGKNYSWNLIVGETPTSVTLNAPTTMYAGSSRTLSSTLVYEPGVSFKDKSLTYSSSKSSVIRVDNAATGKITALKPGTATITVKTSNGKKSSVKITVY